MECAVGVRMKRWSCDGGRGGMGWVCGSISVSNIGLVFSPGGVSASHGVVA